MSKLTIMRGVSGSGKSTWAESQPNALVVSRDRIRAAMFGSNDQDYYQCDKDVLRAKEDLVTSIQDASIASGLRAGMHVIVDNTNVRPKFIKSIVDIGYKAGAEVEVKVIDVPVSVALQRNAARKAAGGRLVPEKVIREQHEALRNSIDWKPVAPPLPEPYHGTPGKPKAFLFDLDGTCFHMNGKRGPYDHNVDVDDPDEVILDIVGRLIDSGLVGIAMSGREEITREASERALFDYVGPRHLFMRPNKDMRKDSIVKAELFDKYVRDHYDVQFVLDDRNQVVDMWRSMGIKTLQVAEGDF